MGRLLGGPFHFFGKSLDFVPLFFLLRLLAWFRRWLLGRRRRRAGRRWRWRMCHRWRLHLPRLRWRGWLHLSLWRRRGLRRGLHLSLRRCLLRGWLHLPLLRWRRSRRHLRRNWPDNVGLRWRSARRHTLAMLLPRQRRGVGRRRRVWQSCRRHLAWRWWPLGRRLLSRWRLTLRCGRRRNRLLR
jgi:hypothetical protein